MRLNVPYSPRRARPGQSQRVDAHKTTSVMVWEVHLSAPAGVGSSILSVRFVAGLFTVVLNQIHSQRPISLQKIILRQNQKR